ncbi:MarR family winged helix-turn-helix transcriptional regulator [Demequina mangrovi]|uniref:Transcriptional regulator, MarR family n=1 Tax=Demequina mangrovi TaxID=1043493 RepID=A0A1H6ZKG9_9MICO|nr:MarR family winged helix-turn-helix transcriptional regulator [Demequina mangrovi]SEJ50192.1 transcriptional regulator, MarR family [Demequina mangrovi]
MSEPTSFLLHRVIVAMDTYADELLRREHGVTFATFGFLAVAASMPGADVTSLARGAGMSKAAASKRIPPLVSDGYLTSEPDPHHGRRLRIVPTPRAYALIAAAGARLEAEFSDLFTLHPQLDESALRHQLETLAGVLGLPDTPGEQP